MKKIVSTYLKIGKPMLSRIRKQETGATLVEYAILVAIISVAAIAIIVVLGGQVQEGFQSVLDVFEARQAQQ